MPETVPVASKWRRLRVLSQETRSEPLPERLFLSANEKTGLSLNVDITRSCHGKTPACVAYCYGQSGQCSFPNAVRQYARNYERLQFLATAPQAVVDEEADAIAEACRRRALDFFRVNGVGDLLPGHAVLLRLVCCERVRCRFLVR